MPKRISSGKCQRKSHQVNAQDEVLPHVQEKAQGDPEQEQVLPVQEQVLPVINEEEGLLLPQEEEGLLLQQEEEGLLLPLQEVVAPAPKRRGRPPKAASPVIQPSTAAHSETSFTMSQVQQMIDMALRKAV